MMISSPTRFFYRFKILKEGKAKCCANGGGKMRQRVKKVLALQPQHSCTTAAAAGNSRAQKLRVNSTKDEEEEKEQRIKESTGK